MVKDQLDEEKIKILVKETNILKSILVKFPDNNKKVNRTKT